MERHDNLGARSTIYSNAVMPGALKPTLAITTCSLAARPSFSFPERHKRISFLFEVHYLAYDTISSSGFLADLYVQFP
jgi:hypothetical protein